MRRLVLIPLLLLSLLVVATAAARDPRLEQVRLNAADNALAKRIALTPRDVGVGWRSTTVPDSDDQLNCPGWSPNLSRFTITGKATRAYTQPTGASIVSAVEVYESKADAAGDFKGRRDARRRPLPQARARARVRQRCRAGARALREGRSRAARRRQAHRVPRDRVAQRGRHAAERLLRRDRRAEGPVDRRAVLHARRGPRARDGRVAGAGGRRRWLPHLP